MLSQTPDYVQARIITKGVFEVTVLEFGISRDPKKTRGEKKKKIDDYCQSIQKLFSDAGIEVRVKNLV